MSVTRRFVTGSVAALAMLALTGSTAGAVSSFHKLRFQSPNAATISWQTGADSPNDPNHKRIRAFVPADETQGCSVANQVYCYALAFSRASLNLDRAAGNVSNLSFEFAEETGGGTVGAGAPRISVEFQNGDIAYLSARYCNAPLASSGNTWGRADFTGATSDCLFYTFGADSATNDLSGTPHDGVYEADGTMSAWAVYASMNPSAVVTQTYLVTDEPGTYFIDRLSMGSGKMYNGPRSVVSCSTESSC